MVRDARIPGSGIIMIDQPDTTNPQKAVVADAEPARPVWHMELWRRA